MKTICFYFLIILSCLFSSCAPSLYFPEKVITTGFDDKNQSFLNVSVKPQFNGGDSSNRPGKSFSMAASAGYSVIKDLGVYAAYSTVNERTVRELYEPSIWSWNSKTGGIFNGRRYEGGLVYFHKSPKDVLFECSAGYSFATIKRTSDIRPQNNFETKYYTVFIQPSWGIKTDNFIFSGGVKLWYQQFSSFDATPKIEKLFSSGNKQLTEIPYFFGCPFVNFEAGVRFLKFNTQVGFPLHVRRDTNDPVLYGFPLYVSVGLTFRLEKNIFSDLKNKNKTESKNEKL